MQQAQIKVFEGICKADGLNYHTQTIRENIPETIVDETAFADLVLCDVFMRGRYFSMNSIISSALCPVMLVPRETPLFREIIFTYDGSASGIHAIKQFTYLFPWCADYKVYLVSVIPINIQQMEYDAQVREWISLHYPNAEVVILKGEVKSEISEFINAGKSNLVVMGAFGRSALSRLFKDSLANVVLERTGAHLFIAHL